MLSKLSRQLQALQTAEALHAGGSCKQRGMQIRGSLLDLNKAVKGLALMSADLDAVGTALFDGRVPELWLKRSFTSLKPLGAYVKEVLERIDFFQTWIDNGQPVRFWLSGFFFTQAFLTGSKQNFARKMKIPIDHIDFDYVTLDNEADTRERPADGVLTYGLFLEGCAWDYRSHVLRESEPKVCIGPAALPAALGMWADAIVYKAHASVGQSK